MLTTFHTVSKLVQKNYS